MSLPREPKTADELKTCVQDLVIGEPTVADMIRIMQFFLNYDFLPLRREVNAQREALDKINTTLQEWRISLRALIIWCAVLGGIISALGTIAGIVVAFHNL